ncbi:MAG: DUF131 domain-containing protein [Candidatus Methanomethylicaceae archaeon]|nr:DUF131 domain-containing protein [Candidatus Verstraetearchaeota archaeon]
MEYFILFGILLILIGMILLMFKRKVEGGALILIGPVPILISSNRNIMKILFILALIFLIMTIWWFL